MKKLNQTLISAAIIAIVSSSANIAHAAPSSHSDADMHIAQNLVKKGTGEIIVPPPPPPKTSNID